MDPLQTGSRSRARWPDDDDLAVEHATLGQIGQQGLDELGEISSEWPLVAAAELDLGAVTEDDAAKTIPFGLVDEPILLGHLPGKLCQHRRDGRHRPAGAPGNRTGARRRAAQAEPWLAVHSKRRSSGQELTTELGIDPGLDRFLATYARAIRAGRAHGHRCRC